MSKPSNFILSTDYATYKNDATGQLSLTIPASIVIAPNTSYTTSQSVNIGTNGAPARTFINHSAQPTRWYIAPQIQVVASGIDSIIGARDYFYYIYVTRTSPTTVTVNVEIPNYSFGAGNLTTESVARNVTVKIATFIPPFTT